MNIHKSAVTPSSVLLLNDLIILRVPLFCISFFFVFLFVFKLLKDKDLDNFTGSTNCI